MKCMPLFVVIMSKTKYNNTTKNVNDKKYVLRLSYSNGCSSKNI